MGFKRTTEGRVFFHNTDENGSNAQKPAPSKKAKPFVPKDTLRDKSVANKPDTTQKQILLLLKSLNEKLKDTTTDRKKLKKELETYKMMVMSLQQKTEKQEKVALEIRKEIDLKNSETIKKTIEAENLSREAFKEFEEARRLIAQIEERSERTESLVKKQQIQVRHAEEQVKVKWDDLKRKSKKEIQELMLRLDQTETSQKQLDERIEEAASQNLKLDRKIEKTIQDRSRFIRKLERIEETVLQTNEAMNARAMVLLTDQETAENCGRTHQPALASAQQKTITEKPAEEIFSDVPWWRKPMRMQAVSVSLIVISAAIVGWGISEVQRPEDLSPNVLDTSLQNWDISQSNMPRENVVVSETVSQPNIDMNNSSDFIEIGQLSYVSPDPVNSESIQSEELLETPENPAVSEFDRIMEEQAAIVEKKDDIGAIDLNNEDELVALLAQDPDALASQLNNIEPSAIPQTEQVVIPKQRTAIIELNEEVNLPTTLQGTIFDRIQSDPRLPEALKEIESVAFSGNAEAQHDLAAIYIAGHGGVEQDYQRASLWFEEAAHNGIANARYNLGVLHHQGIGIERDTDAAFEWYKAAAVLGHPEAQYNLGIAHIEGIGVSYDPQKAAAYFENAANSGVMEAAYNIGLIYENGLLGTAEPDTALMWYKRAADQGSPEAKAALDQLAKTLGMSLADVNKLIEGMEVLQAPAAEKKTLDKASTKQNKPISDIKAAPNELKQNMVSIVQKELMDLGLYPGPIDGVDGALTRDAVRTYQSRHNIPANGEINEALLKHMQFNTIGDNPLQLEQGSSEN